MTEKLHPDHDLKVGDKRECEGLTWTLYKNQFGLSWTAGPVAHNIKITDLTPKTHTSPYVIGGVGYAAFEKAAAKAAAYMHSDYLKAKKLVEAYEAAFARVYPDNKEGPK